MVPLLTDSVALVDREPIETETEILEHLGHHGNGLNDFFGKNGDAEVAFGLPPDVQLGRDASRADGG